MNSNAFKSSRDKSHEETKKGKHLIQELTGLVDMTEISWQVQDSLNKYN